MEQFCGKDSVGILSIQGCYSTYNSIFQIILYGLSKFAIQNWHDINLHQNLLAKSNSVEPVKFCWDFVLVQVSMGCANFPKSTNLNSLPLTSVPDKSS